MNTDLSTTKEETRAAANSTNDDINTCASRISKQQQAVSTAASTASWSRLKDPRIVRVSRAFGGKDRHSKVCTVRGLRDRRVRLSVPTAIQLYDLQDRLGLNQPSKVVDWLLNEAKEAIDELPPLQIPQGSLISSQSNIVHHPMFMNSQVHRSHEFLSPQSDNNKGLKIINDVSGETSHHHRRHEERSQLDPSNNFMRQSLPFPSLFNGSYNPNNLVRWDPSNMTESSSTSSQNNEDIHHHNFSLVQLSSHDVPAAGSHHPSILVYHHHHQPAAAGAPPSSSGGPCADFHGLQLSNISSLITSPVDVRPFHQFHTTTANLLPNEQSNRNHHQFHSS